MAKKRKLALKSEPQQESTIHESEETTQETVDDQPEEPIEAEAPSEDLGNHDPTPDPSADTAATADLDAAADPATAPSNGEAEDDTDESDLVSVQKLLEPFPKDQLVELLRDAAMRHADVLAEVHRIADADPAHRKIFVHGLGWDTNAETLTSAFRQYGEIEDCKAVTDKASGKSKGYGFILFKHRGGARRALQEPQKKIGNRMTACQLASAGPVPTPPPPVSEYTQRKIFVSNVGTELEPQKLMQFFSQFGEIEEGPLGLDKVTGKPKGFCLFVYKTVESAKKALEEPHKNYEGHVLHCQKAIDGPKLNKPGFNLGAGGAHHAGLHQGPGGVGMHASQTSRNGSSSFMGGMANHVPQAGAGHLMAPSHAGLGFNQAASPAAAAVAAGLNPALGQALTAFLATQGAGLGLTNLLGTLGSAGMGGTMVNQAVPGQMVNTPGHGMQGAYGNQVAVGGNLNPGMMGGYGAPSPMQGGYGNTQMGQGSTGRSQQGTGHMGGMAPYMGH